MSMALEGVKIIELAAFAFGPLTCAMLADLGADVIKIEDPKQGDPARGIYSSGTVVIGTYNYAFEYWNRNKRSMAVDIKTAKGKKLVHELVKRSDVFVTNYRENALDRLGMGYETLSQLNSQLIYASASGFGREGPDAERAAYDYVLLARSGLMGSMGEPDEPPPCLPPAMGDHIASTVLAFGIMTALFARQRTGIGQRIDTSLLASTLMAEALNIQATLANNQDIPRVSRMNVGNPLRNTYQAKDGKWMILAILQTDPFWSAFCRAIGIRELENDPRFDSHEKRCANSTALVSLLDTIFATRTRAEWLQRFFEADPDIVCAPVSTVAEAVNDPQVLANKYITTFDHPRLGPIRILGPPIHLSATPGGIRAAAPELGEHTEEILLEMGRDWTDIVMLKKDGVII